MAWQRIAQVLSRPFIRYNEALERSPLVTKSVTSGVMYAAGDAIAQYGEHWHANKERPEGEQARFRMNWQRVGVFAFYGTVIGGPC